MRPAEIDFSSRETPYFDLATGEVLIGRQEHNEYITSEGVNPDSIVRLGRLLRQKDIDIDPDVFDDPAYIDGWDRERFVEYGRWIYRIADPPEDNNEKRLNMSVVKTARQLGIGPSQKQIRSRFGTISNFYNEVGASSSKVLGQFDDWTLEDFISYIKKVGGDTRPTVKDFEKRSRSSLSNPDPQIIKRRFSHIGGFGKLVELAGYPVIRLWDEQDYVNWGVKFMEANNGDLPTSEAADFFSSKRVGPSVRGIILKFGKISMFQRQVAEAYYARQSELRDEKQHKLAIIAEGLDTGEIPLGIYTYDPQEKLDRPPSDLESATSILGAKEVIVRWAKFCVVDEVAPTMEEEVKIQIACDDYADRGFVASIRKHRDIPPADIEYAALTLEVFDDIWPIDDHMKTLKKDEGYENFASNIRAKARERYARRRVAAVEAG